MKNEERYLPLYFDWEKGEQMSGFFTYEQLLEEYKNDTETVNELWNRAFPIPDDNEVKTFYDYYQNGMSDTYTLSFKELREASGYGEALQYWYGFMRAC